MIRLSSTASNKSFFRHIPVRACAVHYRFLSVLSVLYIGGGQIVRIPVRQFGRIDHYLSLIFGLLLDLAGMSYLGSVSPADRAHKRRRRNLAQISTVYFRFLS